MQARSNPRIVLTTAEQRLMDALVAAFRPQWPDAEILMASDAESGLLLVRDRQPALVVLDADAGDRRDSDVLADIRRASDAPVILLTAGGRWSEESRASNIGRNVRLPKPFSVRALIRFARAALE
jgi:DNA-binding response OmpR family regulator